MQIEILSILDKEKYIHNIEHTLIENIYRFKINDENYEIKLLNEGIEIYKTGEISYTNLHKKGKMTKSNVKMGNSSFYVYIITTKLEIDKEYIYLRYNMYSDKEASDLISSFDIKIKF